MPRTPFHIFLLATVLFGCCVRDVAGQSPPKPQTLEEMVLSRDDSYSWSIQHHGELGGCKYVQVHFVSQKWQGTVWRHTLFVILPPGGSPKTKHALMLIAGGSWRDEWGDEGPGPLQLPKEAELMATIAKDLKTPTAIVRQIPFQPMLDGRREDALIAETFRKFYETGGDSSWPLLPAMARAASAAMDATVEIASQQWQLEIEGFTVTGASKRGWTTYLVGACDPRVKAIAPMVIDMLNLGPQMKHQLDAWGDYSRQIEDYTRLGLQKVIGTPAGDALMTLVDPFYHAEQLKMPKLVVLGTNDPYWPVDASRFYYDQLPEPRSIMNIPNNGHGLSDYPRVIGSITALHHSVVSGKPLPAFTGSVSTRDDGMNLVAKSSDPPARVYQWVAHSDDRDFRDATWAAKRLEGNDQNTWTLDLREPETGFIAGMIEAQYDRPGATFPLSLTTQVRVVPDISPQ